MIGWMNIVNTNTDLLIENLFSLDEPWQSHFLHYIAERVTGNEWQGDKPQPEVVRIWLSNQGLQKEIRMMLNSWRGLKMAKDTLEV